MPNSRPRGETVDEKMQELFASVFSEGIRAMGDNNSGSSDSVSKIFFNIRGADAGEVAHLDAKTQAMMAETARRLHQNKIRALLSELQSILGIDEDSLQGALVLG